MIRLFWLKSTTEMEAGYSIKQTFDYNSTAFLYGANRMKN